MTTRAGHADIPELPGHHVHRSRALDELSRADAVPLVVVSAPAGTGKTSLLAEWVKTEGHAGDTGWITVDGGGDVFWDAVTRCLERLDVDVGAVTEQPVNGHERPAILADAIVGADRLLTIVLDDVHRVGTETGDDLDVLLRHTAGHLRLVVAGRGEPALPVYRYRLAGTVLTLGRAELAFDDEEAATLVTALRSGDGGTEPDVLGAEDVGAFNTYHAGWAACLVLAARNSPDRLPTELTPDVEHYLRQEVLRRQAPRTRRLLLNTCAPDELEPALVERLAGTSAALPQVDDASVVVVPLPGERFAYPAVFRDLLRGELARLAPARLRDAHRRTATWLRHEGRIEPALHHLTMSGAWKEAAELVVDELLVGRMLLEGPRGPLFTLLQHLPVSSDHRDAAVVRAGLCLTMGDTVGCSAEVARARRAAHLSGPGGAGSRALSASIAALDALRARLVGHAHGALVLAETAQRALDGGTGVHPVRGGELFALVRFACGIALLRQGALALARTTLEDVARRPEARTFRALNAGCSAHLAVIDALDGYPPRADRHATAALEMGERTWSSDAAAHAALALAALDEWELRTARHHVNAVSRGPYPDMVSRCLTQWVTAELDAADGHIAAASARLHAATADAADTDPWLADRLRVEAARLDLSGGNWRHALRELDNLSEPGEPIAAVVRAGAHARQGDGEAVRRWLDGARDREPAPRVQVEALLVEAEHRFRHNAPIRAGAELERSLRLAAPQRLRRPFRTAGPVIQRLLNTDGRTPDSHRWLHRPATRRVGGDRTSARSTEPVDVDALTAREREVLGLLTDLLTTEEIAEAMFVSVNTVRTHVRGILRKLGVNRRYAAVRRARELGLLDD